MAVVETVTGIVRRVKMERSQHSTAGLFTTVLVWSSGAPFGVVLAGGFVGLADHEQSSVWTGLCELLVPASDPLPTTLTAANYSVFCSEQVCR